MSFPVYNYDKSTELFNRATKVIPSGIYGHLGPAEGQFIPVSKWPMFAEKAKGTYCMPTPPRGSCICRCS
ncbi:MAG: hypothetical protein IJB93_00160 [Clostridia bacterium]|nr:hypothetical protein [Clostridia bacterium]